MDISTDKIQVSTDPTNKTFFIDLKNFEQKNAPVITS